MTDFADEHAKASNTSASAVTKAPSSSTNGSRVEDQSHLDSIWSTPQPKQSQAFGSMFSFSPRSLRFESAQTQEVSVRNDTDSPQTIDDWEFVGDAASFQTNFIGQRSVVLKPGEVLKFEVRFSPAGDQTRAATLFARSSFDQSSPAGLNMTGVNRQPGSSQSEHGCSLGVQIQAKSSEGHANSIQSAMASVGAALNAVMVRQQEGIQHIEQRVGAQIPAKPPAWGKTFDSLVAEGLVRAVLAAGDYVSAGVANATYTTLMRMRADWTGILVEKKLIALNTKVQEALKTSMARGITAAGVGLAREGLMKGLADNDVVPSAMRDAFFHAQVNTLSQVYADAVTSLNNSEGDYAALEAESPGLAFAALEAYREHLMCADRVGIIMQNHTLGLWSAFLARMAIGSHDPEKWEHAQSGAALSNNLYNSTDAKHRMRDLARGVLEIGVIWSYDRRRDAPIADIRHARVEGLQDELKDMLTHAPLGEFNMPIIVQGKVVAGSYAPQDKRPKTTHLRIARNEGGAISIGAEEGTAGAQILEDLGAGDGYEGARSLFARIDQLVLSKVE